MRQSDGDQFGFSGQQGRRIGAVESGTTTRGQELQDVAILLPSGGHDAEHSFDETAGDLAVRATAALPPRVGKGGYSLGVSEMVPFQTQTPQILSST